MLTLRSSQLSASLALVAVAFIWGSSHLVAQAALVGLSVPLLLALRFSVAALLLVWMPTTRGAWKRGVGLGALLFLMYAAHTQGLTGTTAARAAFILGAGALLVPFLGLWAGERARPAAVLAAGLGVIGLGVMLLTGPLRPTVGDAWEVLASVLFAVYLRQLGQASNEHGTLSLVFPQLCVMAGLAWLWALPNVQELSQLTWATVWAVLYLGIFSNLGVMRLQGFALRVVAPERAALWLLLEPVFTLVLSGLVLRAVPTPVMLGGGALVLLALALGHRRDVQVQLVRSRAALREAPAFTGPHVQRAEHPLHRGGRYP